MATPAETEESDARGEDTVSRRGRLLQGGRVPRTLSHREAQVVELLCLGHERSEIARALGIATETVHTYLSTIYAVLGVRNAAAATALWCSGGRTAYGPSAQASHAAPPHQKRENTP